MDIFDVLFDILEQVWYVVPLLIILNIFKSRWFKGVFSEFLVNYLLLKLPKSDHTLIKDVTLPTEDGTTQIDHVVVSKFGIFVVETKNMKGWIFGSARQKQWTQKIYRHTSEVINLPFVIFQPSQSSSSGDKSRKAYIFIKRVTHYR